MRTETANAVRRIHLVLSSFEIVRASSVYKNSAALVFRLCIVFSRLARAVHIIIGPINKSNQMYIISAKSNRGKYREYVRSPHGYLIDYVTLETFPQTMNRYNSDITQTYKITIQL